MTNRPTQFFTATALARGCALSGEQVVEFVENFRQLHSRPPGASKSKLVSIKIPADLLQAFRSKAELGGTRYQTQIKVLMRQWLMQ